MDVGICLPLARSLSNSRSSERKRTEIFPVAATGSTTPGSSDVVGSVVTIAAATKALQQRRFRQSLASRQGAEPLLGVWCNSRGDVWVGNHTQKC